MASFNYPHHVTKDTPAVANEVQSNFDALLAWVMDNLIQKDGTNSGEGPITLPPGPPGAPDQAANKAYVDAMIPVGAMYPYGGTVLPGKWLWCDGTVYTKFQYPLLEAAIKRVFTDAAVPVDSFAVPNLKGKMPAGADVGEAAVFGLGVKGGQRNSELQTHQHTIPAHGHTASSVVGIDSPDHHHMLAGGTAVAGVTGAHSHSSAGGHTEFMFRDGQYNTGYRIGKAVISTDDLAVVWGALPVGGNHLHDIGFYSQGVDTNHKHSVGVTVDNKPAFSTDSIGAGTTLVDKNLPPYVAVNYIIYAGA